MKIIYEDESIIVIYKPAGIASQTANVASKDCVSLIKEHLRKSGGQQKAEPYVGVVHRLDQPVSGLLVFAKNANAAAKLSAHVGGAGMNKIYRAVVEGVISEESRSELKNKMYKDAKEKKAIIVQSESSDSKLPAGAKLQDAILYYKVINVDTKVNQTELEIELKTGRFHQIRAQLSGIGHPIAGDRKYGSTCVCPGDFNEEAKTSKGIIALEACKLTFTHPKTGKIMNFSL